MPNKWGRPPKGRGWEAKLAEEGEGRLNSGSGNGAFAKADLTSKYILTEAKDTDALSYYSLEKNELKKLENYAIGVGRMPVLLLNFSGDEYAIVRRKDWNAIKEQLNINE